MITLLKIGGNVLNRPAVLAQVLDDFAEIPGFKALIHGGGRAASSLAQRLGLEAKMHQGRRITDEAMLEVVTYAYCGLNQQLVAALQSRGKQALGLGGADLDVIRAHKREGWEVDYGYAGDVDHVAGKRIFALLAQGFTPVFSPITHDGQGQLLNTNADTVAAQVAASLAPFGELRLIYLFELAGLMEDRAKPESLIPELNFKLFTAYQQAGVIKDGMIPKLNNAFDAIKAGCTEVLICAPGMLKHVGESSFLGTQIH